MNLVCMTANLTKDPEVRYTPSGMAVANIGLACNRQYKGKDGEVKKDVCFVNGVVWGKQAENAGQHLHKGSHVFIEGRLSSRTWEDKQGGKRSTIEVQISFIQYLDKAKGETSLATDTADRLDWVTEPAAPVQSGDNPILTKEESEWMESPEA